ncbi:vacuolar protein 8-like [Terrapene carolina triunguis]|uniref:vacuolar protein 8-like n=1 Tax=Terrapene triunguis TaxID=2587831 RepID=UPI00115654CD|nr:vacuolar protein 8-like [Terrapene carolina triunguis]
MAQLCEKCVKLLQDFVSLVKRMSSSLIQNIKEYLILISECSCLKRKTSEARQLYKPVLLPHEKEMAREFLQHIETGFEMSPFGKDSLEALRTLAFSENPGLQQSAALYYLHMSQHLSTHLPAEHLESYYALLQSSDMEVQQMSSLSLVNFLLEGNINKEQVVQMGLLEPILELLESGDSTVQCNSCACIMTLAVSESNREAIGSAGVIPLLALANSYDPRVQQNAVGAILNLTRSERIQQVLCREGALPVLILMLESPDSEVQYYSCAALSNVAANSQYHEAMLRVGDQFLLRTLISLLFSSVDKVSSQACVCLRNLATSVNIQADIIAMDILPKLLSLLASSNSDVQQASIALLWILSQHPANQDALMHGEVLQNLGMLLLTHPTDPGIVGHTACIIKNLSLCKTRQTWLNPLLVHGHHSVVMEPTFGSYQLPSQQDKVMSLLKCHLEEVQLYLMNFLSHQEIRFQQLGISTLGKLLEDPEFSSAFSQSQLMEYLEQVRQQTEETQELLKMATSHKGS